jgi:hypothetical protein
MDDIITDVIVGFTALGVACILAIDLAAQIRLRGIAEKLNQVLSKLGK